MATMDVKDANGQTVAIEKPLSPGRKAEINSRPVVLSTEDKETLDEILAKIVAAPATAANQATEITALGGVTETAPASDTASSGLNGRLQRIAQRLTSLIALLPASIGAKNAAGSVSVTTATDDTTLALLGAVAETAPASDTASSGQNGRLQRIAQRLTSLIALLPASLGAKTAANSLAVTTATDDAMIALHGAVNETAPASDTASSGLNGRLQRIAQRITSLIALVPASLGQKAMSASFAVTVASDQTAFPVSPGASAASGGIASTARLASAAATTNATLVKGSAGRVYNAQGYNAAGYPVYLVLYDSAANPPVPGTTTIRKKIPIPAGAAFALDWPVGMTFATGIGYAFTKLAADADTTALAAGDILQFNMDYA